MVTLNFGMVTGLSGKERRKLQELANVYQYHQAHNAIKAKYYEGHVTLGVALPNGLQKIEVGCNWGQKAVDALAARSMFDGFVGSGEAADNVTKLVAGNRMLAEYGKACRDELKHGCVFATLSADDGVPDPVSLHQVGRRIVERGKRTDRLRVGNHRHGAG